MITINTLNEKFYSSNMFIYNGLLYSVCKLTNEEFYKEEINNSIPLDHMLIILYYKTDKMYKYDILFTDDKTPIGKLVKTSHSSRCLLNYSTKYSKDIIDDLIPYIKIKTIPSNKKLDYAEELVIDGKFTTNLNSVPSYTIFNTVKYKNIIDSFTDNRNVNFTYVTVKDNNSKLCYSKNSNIIIRTNDNKDDKLKESESKINNKITFNNKGEIVW